MSDLYCVQCGRDIDIRTGDYRVADVIMSEGKFPVNVYVHKGECEATWKAERQRRQADTSESIQPTLI